MSAENKERLYSAIIKFSKGQTLADAIKMAADSFGSDTTMIITLDEADDLAAQLAEEKRIAVSIISSLIFLYCSRMITYPEGTPMITYPEGTYGIEETPKPGINTAIIWVGVLSLLFLFAIKK